MEPISCGSYTLYLYDQVSTATWNVALGGLPANWTVLNWWSETGSGAGETANYSDLDGNLSFSITPQQVATKTKLYISDGVNDYSTSAVIDRVSPAYYFAQVQDNAPSSPTFGYALSPTDTNGKIDFSYRLGGGSYTNISSLQNKNALIEYTHNYSSIFSSGNDYDIKASYAGTAYWDNSYDNNTLKVRNCTANSNNVTLGIKAPTDSCANATYSGSSLSVPSGTAKICVKFSNAATDPFDATITNTTTGEIVRDPASENAPYSYDVSALSAGSYTISVDAPAEEPYCTANGTDTFTLSAPPVTATPTTTSTPTITPTPTPVPPSSCTLSGLTPTTGCFNTNPTFSATMGGGSDQIQFAVAPTLLPPVDPSDPGYPSYCANPFGAVWNCNSGFQSGTTYSCSLTSKDGYYWSARSSSSVAACTTSCFTPQYQFSIDKAAPADPTVNAPVCLDPAVSSVQFTFNSADTYCGAVGTSSNKAHSYHVQVYDDKGNWYLNNWFNPQNKTILSGSWVSTPYACSASTYDSPCLQVAANASAGILTLKILNVQDSLGNQNPVLLTTNYTLSPDCELPAVVSGSMFVDTNLDGTKGAGESLVDATSSINIVPTYSGGGSPATVSCTYPTTQTYSCSFTGFTDGATYSFGSANLTPYSSQTACSGPSGSCSLTLNNGDTKTLDIGFIKGSFLQTSGGSVHAGGGVSMDIPTAPLPYEAGASSGRMMVLNNAGVVTTYGPQTYSLTAGAQASTPNYRDISYINNDTQFNYAFFQSKFANKTQVLTPSGTTTLTGGKITDGTHNWPLATNSVYEVKGNLTVLDESALSNANVVILVNGNLTISNNFKPITSGSSYIAFIASGTVTVAPTVSEVQAILLSDGQFSDGPTNTLGGLKIIGMVHSQTGLTINRKQITDKPGEYIVEDPSFYIKLANTLGLSSYNWGEVNP